MTDPKTAGLVQRLFEIWNSGDTTDLADVYAEDYVSDYRPYGGVSRGIDGIRAMIERAHQTLTDYHEELHEIVADGDLVVLYFTISGRQTGPWGPVPASGKVLSYDEIAMLRIVDGKVAAQRGIVDNLSALRQLGLVSVPPGQEAARDPAAPSVLRPPAR